MNKTIVVGLALFVGCTGDAGPGGDPGATGSAGQNGADGNDGADGADGFDGNLAPYGDGTAGTVAIAADTDWTTTPPSHDNLQFVNFTVNASKTLTVWSGTTIRCSDTCTINGTILVRGGAPGGNVCLTGNGASHVIAPGADAFGLTAGGGDVTAAGQVAFGGIAYGVDEGLAQAQTRVGPIGGGGGAGNGGAGGGTVTILGNNLVVLAPGSHITARGQNADDTLGCGGGGGGGGGGGIVVLGSRVEITQNGTIDVTGGNGGPASTAFAPGGGGAGGIIHLFAPQIADTGMEKVLAGTRGTGTGTVTAAMRSAGSSGGSSGATPGVGASVDAGNAIVAAVAGDEGGVGLAFRSLIDPTDLF